MNQEEIRKKLEEKRKEFFSDNEDKKENKGTGFSYFDLSKYKTTVWYKPVIGNNALDFIPFIDKNGEVHFCTIISIHQRLGVNKKQSALCLTKNFGLSCPICESNVSYAEVPLVQKIFYNVINKLSGDNKIQLMERSHRSYGNKDSFHHALKKALEYHSELEVKKINIDDPITGYTVYFRGEEGSFPSKEGNTVTYTKCTSFTFKPRKDKYDISILSQAVPFSDLVIVPSYENVKNLFEGKLVGKRSEEQTNSLKESTVSYICQNGGKFGVDFNKDIKVCSKCDKDLFEKCMEHSNNGIPF